MQSPTLTQYQTTEREIAAREARRGFRIHASVYAVVIPVLIAINVVLVPEFLWFFFPMLGWGIGLTMHYVMGYRHATREIEQHQAQVTTAAAA